MIIDAYKIAEQLGLKSEKIMKFETLSARHGHRIWRIYTPDSPYILKWFPDEASAAAEIGSYRLLVELNIPTLPIYSSTEQSLLMEDLDNSSSWKLAMKQDMANPQISEAIARWYRAFHEYGGRYLAKAIQIPPFLSRESDCLEKDCILKTADQLGLSEHSIWQLAIDHMDLLRHAEKRLNLTLNYNDFHWTNLALSHLDDGECKAVIFDYHLLGIGMRYSDCRNVIGSLSESTISAFWDAYGKVDLREEIIDKPLSTLTALVTAVQLPRFPAWAAESRARVINGHLYRDLSKAIDLARTMCASTG